MHHQHLAAVREAGMLTMRALNTRSRQHIDSRHYMDTAEYNISNTRGCFASSGMISSEELVSAVKSLYVDQIRPLSRILKRRLVEQSGNNNLRTINIDSGALRVAVAAAAPVLSVSSVEGGDWEAVIDDDVQCFVDPHDPEDVHPEQLWREFTAYVVSLQASAPSEYRLPASRYACALELHSRNLSCFKGLTLGSLCHIVQLAISQKQILGYRDGALVPYQLSKCLIKKQHAELGWACSATKSEMPGLPFADMDAVRSCMAEIMQMARWSEAGCEPLANIKRTFRSRYHLDLSETLLGYTKLSELLQDLPDLCYLEMRNSGCCVVPAQEVPAINLNVESALSDQGSVQSVAETNVPWQAAKLENVHDIRSMVKNTFIQQPVQGRGSSRRTRSVPKDFGSVKDDWETACHVNCFQHQPVSSFAPARFIVIEMNGCGLGLDVTCQGDALLIEDVGPGPVELWNLSHPGEVVQSGDRIREVNGVSGDASLLLSAVQASDTLELLVEPKAHNAKDDGTGSTVSGTAASEAGETVWDMEPPAPCLWQIPVGTPEIRCDFGLQCGSALAPAPQIAAPFSCGAPCNTQGGKIFIHSGPPPFLMA
eukprot:gnl/MRDRNA2_/MRDRNA2_98154_c0_seq1.p1 gnl/MRDRNA2_/MRDRNA2_98154_c0~~gnl/MRDRNA2_/MRDRNA2_98154_c0_seq1.p1  ORF type:complete len:628 (-),score=108.08 gnl/MRDRNA2_/MRDRNA2_98154_c0_seq1:338-2128(-)